MGGGEVVEWDPSVRIRPGKLQGYFIAVKLEILWISGYWHGIVGRLVKQEGL
jgi:hypothetical protein